MKPVRKRIGIKSKNYDKILSSLESSLNTLYSIEEIKNISQTEDLDLLILEDEDSFQKFKDFKNKYIFKEYTPTILINNNLAQASHLDLIKTEHKGLISVHRNYYGDYKGLSQMIRKSIQPNLPIKKSRFLFVIPVYNEEQRIQNVFDFLDVVLKIILVQRLDARIRFVNDGSNDASPVIINKILPIIQKKMGTVPIDQFLELENLSENTQKAGIYSGGFKNSEANYYFFLDSDNSFFEEDIIKAISIIEDGYYDMIQATKDMTAENRPFIRKALSFCKRVCTYFFLPQGVYDSQTGFKLFNANFARFALPYIKDEYGFAADLQLLNICKKMRFRALQLPVKCLEQDGSHVDPIKDTIKYLLSLAKIAFTKEIYHDFNS